jgi:hypothetical protein
MAYAPDGISGVVGGQRGIAWYVDEQGDIIDRFCGPSGKIVSIDIWQNKCRYLD